ncbi:MAG: LPS assembly lipoprotein LptE [Desulfobacterium sp.]|jgi:outer membrane lipopolysaccharide assembly protein LptE/RlpB|nr:LPS assembly lipoprotein LptE [Desulfobacterium sp.]
MKKSLISGTLAALVLLLTGCGYTFSNSGPLPGNVSRISVVMFENLSFETGAESIFTSALIRELVQKSDAMVVDRDKAEAVITGTVRSITVGALTRSADDAVVERQVSAVIDLDMVDSSGEAIWSVRSFSLSEAFTARSDNALDEAGKREAIEKIAARISERIVDRMRDRF